MRVSENKESDKRREFQGTRNLIKVSGNKESDKRREFQGTRI